MVPRAENPSPTPFKVKNIWNPGKTDMMSELRRDRRIPPYQIDLIEAIKETGLQVLGPAYALAEPGGCREPVTIDELFNAFPSLANVSRLNVLTNEQICSALSRVHFSGDNIGLANAAYILGPNTRDDKPDGVRVEIPDGQRFPISRMALSPIPLTQDEMNQHVQQQSSVWANIASYLQLGQPYERKVYSYQQFVQLALKYGSLALPFSYAENKFNFWIDEPLVTRDDQRKLGGQISIQAVAVLVGPTEKYPPRTLVSYEVYRSWERESLDTVRRMHRKVSQGIIRGREVEGKAMKGPYQGGMVRSR
ncbi:MAG: hypothetical protein WC489_03470 [Patescibacteria group bacterium]